MYIREYIIIRSSKDNKAKEQDRESDTKEISEYLEHHKEDPEGSEEPCKSTPESVGVSVKDSGLPKTRTNMLK